VEASYERARSLDLSVTCSSDRLQRSHRFLLQVSKSAVVEDCYHRLPLSYFSQALGSIPSMPSVRERVISNKIHFYYHCTTKLDFLHRIFTSQNIMLIRLFIVH